MARYAVEVFVTERYVVNVDAVNKSEARSKAVGSPCRTRTDRLDFRFRDGVRSAHFDEDYDFRAQAGHVEEEEDDE